MQPNKKLDRLFQEKLKDLEVTPPDIIWENIEAQLYKKDKKRVLPLWWRTAGAAAIILSIATGGYYFLNTPSNSIPVENTITNTAIDSIKERKNITSPNLTPIPPENQIIIVDSKKSNSEQLNNNTNINKKSTPSETITTTETQNELDRIFNETGTSETGSVGQIVLANSSDRINTTNNTRSEKGTFQFVSSKKPIVSNNNKDLGVTDQFNLNPLGLIQPKQTDKDWILNSNSEKTDDSNSTSVAQNTVEGSTNSENSTLTPISDLNNPDTDEILEKASSLNQKWTVASVIAPVFYNSFNSKGSPMGDQFESNPKQGSNSIAYGIKVGYKIGKKFSLQSGLSLMDVGFSVNEVYMNPTGLTVAKLSNVNYSSSAKFINVDASKEISSSLRPSETAMNEPLKGSLSQEYGYIEVPLELKYNIIDGKFRAHVITGFSTLILNSNEVYVENSEFSSNLGEANNLNDVNFSGNFGLDFDYSINKNLFINVAPIFKIYGNTFSNNTDNFEPYAIGLYTGINYRFD